LVKEHLAGVDICKFMLGIKEPTQPQADVLGLVLGASLFKCPRIRSRK
jgi:hypothetical protein